MVFVGGLGRSSGLDNKPHLPERERDAASEDALDENTDEEGEKPIITCGERYRA